MADKWENNILGFVSEADWLNVGFNVTRQNDPIDSLFGDEKTDNIMAKWNSLASQYQIPMMAQFHGFDTETHTTFRVPVDTHNIEKGLIKTKINQSERLRALLRSGVREDQMFEYVINDGARLAEEVFTRSKVAKNELMATGKVTIKENNLDLVVDYGVPDSQTDETIDFGAGAAKDLPSQIQDIVDAANAQGVILTGIMLSKANLTKMRQDANVQKAVNGNIGAGALVRQSDFAEYLNEEFGISQIITNDLTYGADHTIVDGRPSITSKRYYPTNKISFFATNPSGKMGVGLWGDPPEVTVPQSLMSATTEPSVSPYVYVSQWVENDPVVLWTRASALFMPVLYNPNSLWIATTQSTPKV